ncbi:glycoside hydrolase family 43 protein [Agromyces atrinae]|uniref:glycoside hydrolase family 43 protein n=1 Tax=Agromyces atrinae TaxID=592376 RepID=UPI001F58EA92|nr:glycoside hydrolase family 43 protein [Agromyces atrinae]MCI2957350.1 glycoside hydrolase family 43 protein [Agromyces atrinae]
MSLPIVPGFHPDPSICRVGDDFYLVNSTFEYLPGVPVRHSRDLVNWRLIGHAIERPSQMQRADTGGGIFAPTIRHHDGRFWMITTDIDRVDDGHLIVWAEDAAGPWSEPVFTAGAVGIDPDLAWDGDGDCHLTWARFGEAGTEIAHARVDPASGELLSEPRLLWQGTGLAATEGPHLYRRGDWWYLLVAEGGTERGHAVSIARSRSIEGVWESCPANPILSHRSTVHPVQNTGHADLVELASGEWAMVHLGVRPRGMTPGFHVNGRETFLTGIDWVDDWPVVAEDRYVVPPVDTAFTDRFDAPALDLRWISPGRWPAGFAALAPGGGLDLAATDDAGAGLLAVRASDDAWEFDAEIEGEAAVVVRLDDDHEVRVVAGSTSLVAVAFIGGIRIELGERARPEGAVTLSVRARPGAGGLHPRGGPDVLALGVVEGGEFEEIAAIDGRYTSTEVAGGFTGRVVGIATGAVPAHVTRVDYRVPLRRGHYPGV